MFSGICVFVDTLWQLSLRPSERMDSGTYPVREGEPDCSYYIRTGLCRFGATCRFNHPPNRKLAIATARMKGEYPERIGQPECQYYLKTGTCKFGATCKFHHPRDKAGIAGRVTLNVLGFPLRPNETECAYYLRTGQCKFGNTCKFHHPQPSNMMVSLHGSSVYPPVHSPTTPTQQSYPGGMTNWPLSRASFIPNPRWQGPSSYAPLILPQGVVSVPGWNAYGGQLSSVSSPESQQQTAGSSQIYGTSHQKESANVGSQGMLSQYHSGSVPVGYLALQRENVFPERPGQPECQFYMKTGDCKYGAVCKFHHPRERLIPVPDCVLSPLGLPYVQESPYVFFILVMVSANLVQVANLIILWEFSHTTLLQHLQPMPQLSVVCWHHPQEGLLIQGQQCLGGFHYQNHDRLLLMMMTLTQRDECFVKNESVSPFSQALGG
ncbi:zinc finger CCCH domain-containing protein ZFN-like isoform X2 [Diospyros lotus]|uniref:zinc finger CCCH domain-containing protein ZFN-like isoform X2 n=1 Tax=Diospyros lotus TaxID=55363 RepID=UPI00224FF791|nr:zinc finger CCCH domain-containing protein ZFN-like isoform X2 [Diospyros lotus]XP_052175642.1 zinc finger CCCH domain-containing protein ZFN-like isoform X2 [Diospyros lotus]